MKRFLLLSLVLTAGAAGPQVLSQTPTDFWLQTRGPEGGAIVGFARLSDGEILASAKSSGVFRSLDEGVTWQLANGNIAHDYGGGGIWMGPVVADSDGDVYLVNGWGIFRGTRNAGSWVWTVLWQGPGGPSAVAILSTVQHHRVLASSWEGAVSYSDDHGDSWTKVLLPFDDPQAPEWGVGVTVAPNGDAWAATTNAVYKSVDAGETWTLKYRAADYSGPLWSWSLVKEFVGPIAASPEGDVFVGFNYGDGTLRINLDGSTVVLPTYNLAYFPTSFAFGQNGAVYAGVYQNGGVIYSTDRGDNWQPLGTLNGNPGMGWRSIWAVAALPNDGTVLAGAAGDGVLRLSPGPVTQEWAPSKTGMIGSDVSAVAVDGRGSIYAAAIGAGLFRSDDSGNSWIALAPDRWVSDTMGVRDIAIDSHGTVFAAWHAVAVSTDRGLTWQDRWVGNPVPPEPGPRATCLLIDRNDRLAVGTSQGVFFTSDGGLTWQSSSLTMSIYSLSMSQDGQTLSATTWGAGAGDGLYVSTDAGATWRHVPFFAGHWLVGTAVSSSGAIFAAPTDTDFVPDQHNPGVWRSADGGNLWQKLTGFDTVGYGLSGGELGLAAVLAFNSDGVLYASCAGSVVRSKDAGDTWESVSSGLSEIPVRSVLDLTFDQDGYSVAGTWGAGVFRSRESTAPFIRVAIDLGGKGAVTKIVLHSNGQLSVTIPGSATFDAGTVDPSTVRLAGASVRRDGSGKWMALVQDVNRDGYNDLVVHFSIPDLQLKSGDTEATLTGKTFGGRSIRGTDQVLVVR